jgi:hypothetical protein
MNIQQSVQKKSLLTISAVATVLTVLIPSTAHADPATIVDLRAMLIAQSPYATGKPSLFPVGDVDITKITTTNTTAIRTGMPATTFGDTWFVGSSLLRNDSDLEQTLSTSSFSRNITLTVSTEVTKGISLAVGLTAKVGFDDIGVAGSWTTTFSLSTTNAQSTSDSVTYTAPSQSIRVPPNTTAQVTVSLQKVIATGTMALRTELGGTYRAQNKPTSHWWTDVSLYDEMRAARNDSRAPALPASLTLNPTTKRLDFNGEAIYTATYGSAYKVEVTYLPHDLPVGQKYSSPAPLTYTLPAVRTTR